MRLVVAVHIAIKYNSYYHGTFIWTQKTAWTNRNSFLLRLAHFYIKVTRQDLARGVSWSEKQVETVTF